ncbi:transcriptional regulator [Trinickia violacea]|uniref:Transcriptional regulator n=1 Tax=Trinickia violacea TaxID=2571746 RepID=A0A4P8IW91_9BURK|nr:transcriptional regulator [Trinickia violacea]QCP53472.1 transcriptional regulator [Trinickia violacea]
MAPTHRPESTSLSEHDILAYADGVLAPDRAAHLHDYLESRPGEARRVAFYARLNAQIKHAFHHAGESSPPGKTSPPREPWRAALHRRWAQLGNLAAVRMLMTLAVAVLATSGWIAAIQVSPQALDNAAVMALARASDPTASAADPAPALAGGEPAPDLGSVGLRFVAKKLVQLGPFSRAAEFVYVNADGKPVVLLTASTLAASSHSQWSAHRAGALRLLTWTEHHQRYVLAGNADTHGLMRAADTLTLRRS